MNIYYKIIDQSGKVFLLTHEYECYIYLVDDIYHGIIYIHMKKFSLNTWDYIGYIPDRSGKVFSSAHEYECYIYLVDDIYHGIINIHMKNLFTIGLHPFNWNPD